MFAALAGSQPIPSLEPQPQPTQYPWPSVSAFDELSMLAPGAQLPSWGAPLLGGGRLDSASLMGKPTVLWFWSTWACEGCPNQDLREFAQVAKSLDGKVNFVMVSAGEQTTGQVERLLRETGIDVPPTSLSVAWDWDGEIGEAFIPAGQPIVVADERGRLVDVPSTLPTVERLKALFPKL